MTIKPPVEYRGLFCNLIVVRRAFEKPFLMNGSDIPNECLVPSLYNLVKQDPVGLTVIEVSQHQMFRCQTRVELTNIIELG
jgi:hypothetical protein